MAFGRSGLLFIGAACGLLALASPAHAGVEEVAVGLLAHNIQVNDPKNANKEDGPALDLQVSFSSPEFLEWAGSPRPYVAIAPNLAGETSFAAVGLAWRIPLAEDWFFEPGFGYALHNGEVSNPFPNGDPRATAFTDENVLMGSEDVFRSSFALTHQVNERFGLQVIYVHYSHGQIIGSGRNQGMDQLGLRLTYALAD